MALVYMNDGKNIRSKSIPDGGYNPRYYTGGTSLSGISGGTSQAQGDIMPRANIYSSAMSNAINKLNNIEKFTYNQKDDPLYQQYQEMYQRNAKLAMQDTMGQAAALTGGYGSSYAETAGQAMYNQQMNQMNDRALDLYNIALNSYNSYVDLASKQASATISAFGADQDAINTDLNARQWNADFAENQRQYNNDLALKYAQMQQDQRQFNSEMAYKNASLSQNQAQFEADMSYKKARDEIEDSRYNKEFNYQKSRDSIADGQYNEKMQYQAERDRVSDEQFANELAYKYAVAGFNPDGTLNEYGRAKVSSSSSSGTSKGSAVSSSITQWKSLGSQSAREEKMDEYANRGDFASLGRMLDEAVAANELNQKSADEYISKYYNKYYDSTSARKGVYYSE